MIHDRYRHSPPTTSLLMDQLPRSIRWRLQLHLYEMPYLESTTTPTTPSLLRAIQQHNATTLQQHQQRFQQLVEKYVHVQEEEEEEENDEDIDDDDDDDKEEEERMEDPPKATKQSTSTPKKISDMDPLTAMLMEQTAEETRKAELMFKYKKERARWKRGLVTEQGRYIGSESDGVDQASLAIINKDLQRLPHPTSNNGAASGNLSPEEQTRINQLKEILYVYAQEHASMGYRQGMHEIASYLLYALEIEQKQYLGNPLYGSIVATCFVMLERVLEQLGLAYDASGEQSLQRMSQSILSKIHQNAPSLFQKLTTSPHIPPPPIYCTRWVRLLFSREVVGFENVFGLWDVFFQFHPQIMRALEMTSVARILLLHKALMDPNNSPLDLLMNVPQQQDIRILTNLLKDLMAQTNVDPPIVIPESHMTLPPPPSGGRGFAPPVVTSQVPSPQGMTTPRSNLPKSYLHDSSPPQEMNNNVNTSFSFSKMKDTLGKKSESIRKKIITATNEWSRENNNSGSTQFSIPSDIFAAAGDVLRQGSFVSSGTSDDQVNSDPLRNPGRSSSTMPMAEPPSPRKHQHARWSQGLNERILILQNYLMVIESSSSHPDESGGPRKVPPEVWEAMADLQRMQQELHNYSKYMS